MLLMVIVWSAFFMWGVTVTQNWLASLQVPLANLAVDPWQATLAHFFEYDTSVFVPAALLVFVSLAIFFYRLPRVRGRLSVPIEFALTTLLFVGANFAVMQLLQFLAALLVTFSTGAGAAPVDTASSTDVVLTELSIVITLAMLAYLYWLQWSGRLLLMWRRRQHGAAVR